MQVSFKIIRNLVKIWFTQFIPLELSFEFYYNNYQIINLKKHIINIIKYSLINSMYTSTNSER